MPRNLVEALYKENREIAQYLEKQRELSYYSSVENSFRKTLLLAAASYFEATVTEVVLMYVKNELKSNHPLFKIVKTRGIDRQYHTWFDWDARNANKFFAMFGDGFKAFMHVKIGVDAALENGISAFVELGSLRNNLVHQNFAEFTVEKTPDEIYNLYRDAMPFVDGLGGALVEFSGSI